MGDVDERHTTGAPAAVASTIHLATMEVTPLSPIVRSARSVGRVAARQRPDRGPDGDTMQYTPVDWTQLDGLVGLDTPAPAGCERQRQGDR